jgi:hypothetical protein
MATIKVSVKAKRKAVLEWLDMELPKNRLLKMLDDFETGVLHLVRDDAVPTSLGERYTVRGRHGPDFGIAGTFFDFARQHPVDDVGYEGSKVGHVLCGSVLPLNAKSSKIIFGVFPINEMPEVRRDLPDGVDTPEAYEDFEAELQERLVANFNRLTHEWLRSLLDQIDHDWPITHVVELPDKYGVVPSSIRPYPERWSGKISNFERDQSEPLLTQPPDGEPAPSEPKPVQQDSGRGESAPATSAKSPSGTIPPAEGSEPIPALSDGTSAQQEKGSQVSNFVRARATRALKLHRDLGTSYGEAAHLINGLLQGLRRAKDTDPAKETQWRALLEELGLGESEKLDRSDVINAVRRMQLVEGKERWEWGPHPKK